MPINLSMDKQNVVYPYNGILFSHINEVHAKIWMNLENIMLSERSQSQKPHVVWFHFCECPKQANPETESRLVVSKGWGGGGWKMGMGDEEWLLMSKGFPFGVMEMFWNQSWWCLHTMQACEYTKTHWIVYFKSVDCQGWCDSIRNMYLVFEFRLESPECCISCMLMRCLGAQGP